METTTTNWPFRPGDKMVYTSEAGHIFLVTVLGRGDRDMIEVTMYGGCTGCVYPESLSKP
jgi:hypothetical protein